MITEKEITDQVPDEWTLQRTLRTQEDIGFAFSTDRGPISILFSGYEQRVNALDTRLKRLVSVRVRNAKEEYQRRPE